MTIVRAAETSETRGDNRQGRDDNRQGGRQQGGDRNTQRGNYRDSRGRDRDNKFNLDSAIPKRLLLQKILREKTAETLKIKAPENATRGKETQKRQGQRVQEICSRPKRH